MKQKRDVTVNALDLARLLQRQWMPNWKSDPWANAEAKAFDKGAREVLRRVIRLLKDDEARSTISVKG